MKAETICEFDEESIPNSEDEVKAFEHQNHLVLPDVLRQILLETNGGYVQEERLKFDEEDKVGVEEIFGISTDDVDWASSIVPLSRWVKYKKGIYENYPTLEAIESLNGDVSRYFVFSGIGAKFHLLNYTGSEQCKGVCYLDLAGDDQTIVRLGEDLSCVLVV